MTRRIRSLNLTPGSLPYRLVFGLARVVTRLGLLKPNTQIHYIGRDDWILVLTPLAGSSSIRRCVNDVRVHELREPRLFEGKTVYVLSREPEHRMTSFYNKKVRNPTNLAKAVLLATCPPIDHRTSPEAFARYLEAIAPTTGKDKHLYTLEQICAAFGRTVDSVVLRDIRHDRDEIERLLHIRLDRIAKSTKDVATFAEPLPVPFQRIEEEISK